MQYDETANSNGRLNYTLNVKRIPLRECGGVVVDHRIRNREFLNSIPTGGIVQAQSLPTILVKTQEAVASFRHDCKIDDCDVKPQNTQTRIPLSVHWHKADVTFPSLRKQLCSVYECNS